jgi:hypothetical protein
MKPNGEINPTATSPLAANDDGEESKDDADQETIVNVKQNRSTEGH